MNTYVPVRKIIKVLSTKRNTKQERKSLLQECSDPGTRRRSRFNPWVLLFGLLAAAIYLFHHRAYYLPAMIKQGVKPRLITHSMNTIEPTDDYIPHRKIKIPHRFARPSTANAATKTIGDFYKTNIIKGLEQSPTKHPTLEMPLCQRKKPYAKFQITMKSVSLTNEEVLYPLVTKGGMYHPPDCKTRLKVGIVVPYRDREYNLGIFLYNIHPFLMRQKLDYQIFVIEQEGDTDLFNKGRLLNAGFNEMMKFNTFHCVVFHDLDLLPMHEAIAYSCPTLPRHMCSQVNDTLMEIMDPPYLYQNLFGGVVSMTREQFERANGFSNLYFGWGGEDNDLFWRLRAAGYPVVQYNSSIGVYLMQPHTREQPNPYRQHLLSGTLQRYKSDGLSNSEYIVISTNLRPLCTHIVVNINPKDVNVKKVNKKWAKAKYY